ncbi:MAG: MoxR family ATPase [Oscillospiraceae bacterium]|nr:MoxR family ATPase [Oscillospiraceae bacterium]
MPRNVENLAASVGKVIVGKDESVKNIICAMLCAGHVLVEDVPGVGKTQLVAALAKSVDGRFNRIQLTPDIMPSDIVGFSVVNSQSREFEYHPGAAMCNFLLADEINRASPKVQSGLLEIMEEKQISLDGKTHDLPKPFIVFATQNPVETDGTYHLPEAQMDRFFMRLSLGYPTAQEELMILRRNEMHNPILNITEPVLSPGDIVQMQEEVKQVKVNDLAEKYVLNLVLPSRCDENVTLGISPRGRISVHKAAKAMAYINNRDYVTPQDIKNVAVTVLSHRIILSPKGKIKYGDAREYVKDILKSAEIPTGN